MWRDSGSGPASVDVPVDAAELGEPLDLGLRDRRPAGRSSRRTTGPGRAPRGRRAASRWRSPTARSTISPSGRPASSRHPGTSSSDHGGPSSPADRVGDEPARAPRVEHAAHRLARVAVEVDEHRVGERRGEERHPQRVLRRLLEHAHRAAAGGWPVAVAQLATNARCSASTISGVASRASRRFESQPCALGLQRRGSTRSPGGSRRRSCRAPAPGPASRTATCCPDAATRRRTPAARSYAARRRARGGCGAAACAGTARRGLERRPEHELAHRFDRSDVVREARLAGRARDDRRPRARSASNAAEPLGAVAVRAHASRHARRHGASAPQRADGASGLATAELAEHGVEDVRRAPTATSPPAGSRPRSRGGPAGRRIVDRATARSGWSISSQSAALPTVSTTRCIRGLLAGFLHPVPPPRVEDPDLARAMCTASPSHSNSHVRGRDHRDRARAGESTSSSWCRRGASSSPSSSMRISRVRPIDPVERGEHPAVYGQRTRGAASAASARRLSSAGRR